MIAKTAGRILKSPPSKVDSFCYIVGAAGIMFKLISYDLHLAVITVIASATWMIIPLEARSGCHDRLVIGEDLRLTIHSAPNNEQSAISGAAKEANAPRRKVGTVCAISDELQHCWVPPPTSEAKAGTEVTLRFAFKRNGEIIAPPRITYLTPRVSADTRESYLKAIRATLDRCTPMHFTEGLASVIIGHPFVVRFVDDRTALSQ